MLPRDKKIREQEQCALCGRDPEDCICLPSSLDLNDPDWNDDYEEDDDDASV